MVKLCRAIEPYDDRHAQLTKKRLEIRLLAARPVLPFFDKRSNSIKRCRRNRSRVEEIVSHDLKLSSEYGNEQLGQVQNDNLSHR